MTSLSVDKEHSKGTNRSKDALDGPWIRTALQEENISQHKDSDNGGRKPVNRTAA